MSAPAPTTAPAATAAAAYRHPPAEALIFDESTAIIGEELAAFLAGWLGLAPEDYAPADLQTAAAVLVDRLGLRSEHTWRTRIITRRLGFDR